MASRILIVEDAVAIRDMLCFVLEQQTMRMCSLPVSRAVDGVI